MRNTKLWKQMFEELFGDHKVIHEDKVSLYIEETFEEYTRIIGLEKTDTGIKMIVGDSIDSNDKADLIINDKAVFSLSKSNYENIKTELLNFVGIMLVLTKDLIEALESLAKEKDVTLNDLIIEILNDAILKDQSEHSAPNT